MLGHRCEAWCVPQVGGQVLGSEISVRHGTAVKGGQSMYVWPMVQVGEPRAASHLLTFRDFDNKAWQMKEVGGLPMSEGVAWYGDWT